MTLVRFVALIAVAGFALGGPSLDITVAQDSGFGCKDFLTPEATQAQLAMDPSDPYGLDPNGNGIACDEPGAQVALKSEIVEVLRPPLDARLGGTFESWEAEFGPPVEQDGEDGRLFPAYDLPGFSAVIVHEHLGRVESISLFAPRPEREEWTFDQSHQMNWTAREAHDIAQEFLPRDARIDEPVDEGSGFVYALCTSDALATEVPPEVYDYVDNSPQYGRCSYALFYEENGFGDRISWISIELAIEEPLGAAQMAATVAAHGDQAPPADVPPAGLTAEESAYAAAMGAILTGMGESLERAADLFEHPRYEDQEWVIALATELVIWQASYTEAVALQPPPSMVDIHALLVEALRLFSEAADDMATGIGTFDAARLNQALDKIAQGQILIDQARGLLDEFFRERGG